MRYLTISFTLMGLFLFAWSFASCDRKANEAVAYNDQIVEMQDAMIQSLIDLEQSFAEYEDGQMDSAYRQLLTSIQQGKAKLENVGVFEGDSTLYRAARDLFDRYERIATIEYAELISYLKIPDSLYTLEDQERSFQLLEKVTNDRTEAHDHFIRAQKQFGDAHGFIFNESEPQAITNP